MTRALLRLLCLTAAVASAELLTVVTLTRHGARAPSKGVIDVCPGIFPDKQAITDMFVAQPSCLTVTGLNEMYEVGSFLRHHYVEELDFAPSNYSRSARQYHFRARGMPRHLESGTAITNGLFPVGTGPIGYPERAQPVAVYSEIRKFDNLLGTPPMACSARAYADADAWADSAAPAYLEGHEELLAHVSDVCGVALDDPSTGPAVSVPERVKFVADAMDFMESSGLPMPADLSDADHVEFRQLSFSMLLSSLTDTDDKRTYWTGRFPTFLAHHFKETLAGSKNYKVMSHVASRELLYALGHLYGFDYDFPPLPHGKIPPGTTLAFELHADDESGDPFVRVFMYNPSARGRTAALQPLVVGDCDADCPLDKFDKVAAKQFEKTGGDFSHICPAALSRLSSGEDLAEDMYVDYEDWDGVHKPFSEEDFAPSSSSSSSEGAVSGGGVFAVVVACMVSASIGGVATMWVARRRAAPAAPVVQGYGSVATVGL